MFIEEELRELGLLEKRTSEYGGYYGALWVAAKYCGFDRIPGPIRGTWQHGHIGSESNFRPELVVEPTGKGCFGKVHPQFVAREDQVLFLKSQGYKNVFGIGLPFLYTDVPQFSRNVGSVLIMPGHSLEQEKAVSDYAEYVRFVEKLSADFSHVVICLHGIDYDKGHAREAFETAGFRVIRGSAIEDSNSLERMAFLFSRFEYVSTNDHGSHVYYAAAAGCKVSIEGPPSVRDLDGLKKHSFFRGFPEGLENFDKRMALRRSIYPFLYGPIKNAELRIDWALDQLGYPEKRSPQNLKRTLGWTFTSRFITLLRPKLGKIFYSVVRLKAPVLPTPNTS